MKAQNNLGTDPIGRLVIRLAVPSMLAQFVSVLYSIVDRMFIGNLPEIGDTALAGVGVAGPIVTLLSSFASLIGIGGAPLMSIRMGEKQEDKAREIVANSFIMLLVISAVLTVAALLLKRPLLMWFGASGSTFPYADAYMTIYVCGTVFALMSTGMNQFIISQGYAKTGMFSVLIGAAANIILDPLFMFGLDMGVEGAAIATVLSQVLSCAFVLGFLFSKKPPIRITFGGYRADIMKRILAIGFAPFMIIAFDSILIITLNTVLQTYGGAEYGDMYVTCATIVQSFMLIVTMPLGGITGGTQAILGFNYGAGQPDRIKKAQKYILALSVIFTTVMFLAARLVPQYFVRLFSSNTENMELCVWAIQVFTLAVIPLAFQYTIVDGFTGMGMVKISIPLSFFRKGIFFLFVFGLPAIWGAKSVFWTEPLSDLIAGIVSSAVYLKVINRALHIQNKG
ncbi:MAG TPA: MATE family efflux transporter [Candidatus Caccomorpha excrementavium]|nr:MATE family efflux transporter [Candidatus Caccomorpha excrementavium]